MAGLLFGDWAYPCARLVLRVICIPPYIAVCLFFVVVDVAGGGWGGGGGCFVQLYDADSLFDRVSVS